MTKLNKKLPPLDGPRESDYTVNELAALTAMSAKTIYRHAKYIEGYYTFGKRVIRFNKDRINYCRQMGMDLYKLPHRYR